MIAQAIKDTEKTIVRLQEKKVQDKFTENDIRAYKYILKELKKKLTRG